MLPRLGCFAFGLVLTACSAAPDGFEAIGEATQAETVCASGETIEGIDVSKWQGGIDWQAVAGSGIAFATTRGAYGTSKDEYFDANWAAMKDAGIVRGAYQWFLPDEDPIAQAQFLLDLMGPLGPGDLPPLVDVEDTGGQSADTIVAKLSQWLDHVENATGRKAMIYSGKYFWQDHVGGSNAFVDHPLWIPNYSYDCPNLPDGSWTDWKFFQYTDTGSVPGVSGNVDRDKFNGTLADLLAFANGGFAAEFVSQSFPYAADPPLVVHAGETIAAHIELRNVGSRPWNSSTMLATTEPRDRKSAFAGPEWPSAGRLAAVEGEVLPGETFKFEFLLHAPSEPGTYSEYFGVVQEGEAWFSDPGQGGPPDDQLQGVFEVVATGSTGSTSGGGDDDAAPEPTADEPRASDDGEADGGRATRAPARAGFGVSAALLGIALAAATRRRKYSRSALAALIASASAGCNADLGSGVANAGAGGSSPSDSPADTTGTGGAGAEAGGTAGHEDPIAQCGAQTSPCAVDAECCDGLVCGTTTLGDVCCGNEGVACATENGEDCCGDLLCIDGVCGHEGLAPEPCDAPCKQPPALVVEKQRLASIGGSFLGICGDANHTYGYHVPAANLPSDDYSLQGAANAPVCDWYASAIDIGMDWPVSRDWLKWLIVQIRNDDIKGIGEVIGSYDGVNVRYWSDGSGWSDDGVPYQGSGHDTWTHVAIYRSTALDDHGLLAGWTANSGP